MTPLKFNPILKTLVWGGEKIAPYKGIETEQHHIGESWELSGVKGNESVVADGPLAGRSIASLVHEYKEELVGKHVYGNTGDEFPLLIKFIDALTDLSIQVHPNDELAARRHNGSKGKTEMWYVVDAEPGAHLLAGLTQSITPEEYAAKVADGTITGPATRFIPAMSFSCRQAASTPSAAAASLQKSSRLRTSPTASMTTDGWAWTASLGKYTRSWPRTPSTIKYTTITARPIHRRKTRKWSW